MMIVVLLIIYRNWRYEQELDSLLWKIDFRDIQIPELPNVSGLGKAPRVYYAPSPRSFNGIFLTWLVSLSSLSNALVVRLPTLESLSIRRLNRRVEFSRGSNSL